MSKKVSYAKERVLAIVQAHVPDVTAVKDSRRDIAVNLEAKDSTKRGRKRHGSCALAKACRRQLAADAVIVSASRAYVVKGGIATRYVIDEATTREIIAFDRGSTFTPGTYELRAPGKMQRIGAGYERSYGPKKSTRRKAHVVQGVRTVLGRKK